MPPSVCFSTNLGRSLAHAIQLRQRTLSDSKEWLAPQPAWIGKIPAQWLDLADPQRSGLEESASWSDYLRLCVAAAEALGESRFDSSPPTWWNELNHELELRAGLIREQWEARGPGLLAAIALRVADHDFSEPLQVELLLPLGGAASGLLRPGRAWMAATLHDVSPHFVEPLRVGWLVACQARSVPADARRLLLEAAEEVEWLVAGPTTDADLAEWLENPPFTASLWGEA